MQRVDFRKRFRRQLHIGARDVLFQLIERRRTDQIAGQERPAVDKRERKLRGRQAVALPQFDVGSGVRYWITYTSTTSMTITTSASVTGTFSYGCIGRKRCVQIQ